MSSEHLKAIATETVDVMTRGEYRAPSGRAVALRGLIDASVSGSRLYRPSDFDGTDLGWAVRDGRPSVEVTAETTGSAARRLAKADPSVCALNFASARNPGGGFLRGAKAQEEDLARCSALYATQMPHSGYYAANRAERSLLYTDHLIYSPQVPFFRDEALALLEEPFVASVITTPAPNAQECLRTDPTEAMRERIRETLLRRALQVLRVAAHHGHRTVVLGAWGCGVFGNQPHEVAAAFDLALGVITAFDRVVFAIYEGASGRGLNLRAFEERFGQS